jgi:putative sporulation protein YtxC
MPWCFSRVKSRLLDRPQLGEVTNIRSIMQFVRIQAVSRAYHVQYHRRQGRESLEGECDRMRKWKIGAKRDADKLCACLEQVRERLYERGIVLVGEQASRGAYTFYTYRLIRPSEAELQTMEALAEAVARFVTDVWERRELARIVTENFYYDEQSEVEHLVNAAASILAGLQDGDGQPLRIRHIMRQIAEQLQQSGELVVEGLLRFRMQEFHQDLHRVIEQAIDEYLLEIEQQEFVKLIRYFLEAQEVKMPLLHLVYHDEAMTMLYDAEGQTLVANAVPGLSERALSAGFQVEELINALIALAPEQLHLHLQTHDMPSWLDMVKKIFVERSHVCHGCSICQVSFKEARDDFSKKV